MTLIACVASLAAAPLAGQASSPASAPISGVSYSVTYTRRSAASRVVTSEMTFDVSGTGAVLLSLPAWTPGEYEIQNFARNVLSFTATENGTAISWDKMDPDTWEVHPARAGRVTVTFDYQADTLDNGSSWSKPDFLLFNGTNLFLYPEGLGSDFPATVRVATEPDWKIVTGLRQTAPFTYASGNYHDLVDNPFFIGVFDLDSAQISGNVGAICVVPGGEHHGSGAEASVDGAESGDSAGGEGIRGSAVAGLHGDADNRPRLS
jgi:Predicted protease with the C-terminal PDZ domain